MRSIDRRQLLVIVVAVLAVTAVPASVVSASDQLVVGSQHDSKTDYENAQQSTNLTATSSGDGALELVDGTTVIDDFEDGDVNEWSGPMEINQTPNSGSYNGLVDATDDTSLQEGSRSFENITEPANITFAIRTSNFDSRSATRILDDGTKVIEVGFNNGPEFYYFNGSTVNTFGSASSDTYYVIKLADIDFAADTYDIYVDGSKKVDDAEMAADANSLDSIAAFAGDPSDLYIDDIEKPGDVASGKYVSQIHNVTNPEEAAINITASTNVSTNATIRTDGGTVLNQTTITSTGNHSLVLSSTSSEKVEVVLDVNVTGENPAFTVADDSILFANQHPKVDNASASPSGGETVSSTPVTLSINVSDGDFGTAQGENVTVEFRDNDTDDVLGTETLASNGTATTKWDNVTGGENEWYVVATDEYGGKTDSRDVHGGAFSFNAPSDLRIFHETEPSKLIDDNATFRVRFFVEGQEKVIERETSNGTVSLEGLPADQRFIVTVRANDTSEFTYRRIIVDSLIETQDVYLLNRSKTHSQITFQLDDPTGQFPPEDTTLYIEKPITKDFDGDGTNETRYEVIAGDTFGAAAEFPIILQDDARYRLRVTSNESSRILGAYSVSGDDIQPLQIQRIEPEGDSSTGSVLYGGIEEPDNERRLAIRYRDPGNRTAEVTYRVLHENGTVWIENTTREANQFADLYPLPDNASENASYTVEYEIVREDGTITGSFQAGQIPGIAGRFGMNPHVLGIVSWVAILSTMGLFVIVNPGLAPIGGSGMATVLTIIGTVSIPAPILGISGAVSVLVLVGGR